MKFILFALLLAPSLAQAQELTEAQKKRVEFIIWRKQNYTDEQKRKMVERVPYILKDIWERQKVERLAYLSSYEEEISPVQPEAWQKKEIADAIGQAEAVFKIKDYKDAVDALFKYRLGPRPLIESRLPLQYKDGRTVQTYQIKGPEAIPYASHYSWEELDRRTADLEKIDTALKNYAKYQQEAYRRYNEAIRLTLEYYHIRPKDESGAIRSSSPENVGKTAEWNPRFSEREDIALSPRGDPEAKLLAVTRWNASVGIKLDAFESPDSLAQALYHESLHFINRFDPHHDSRNMPREEAEVRMSEYLYLQGAFRFSDEKILEYLAYIAEQDVRGNEWQELIDRGFNPFNPKDRPLFPAWEGVASDLEQGDLERMKAGAESNFLDAETRMKTIVSKWDQARNALKFERSEREFRWEHFRAWVGFGCLYTSPLGIPRPDEDFQIQQSKKQQARYLREYLLTNFTVLPQGEILEGLARDGRRMSGCEKNLVRLFLTAEAPLSAEWLVGRMDDGLSGGRVDKILGNLLNAVGNGMAVVVRTVTKPLVIVGKPFAAFGRAVSDSASRAPFTPTPRSNSGRIYNNRSSRSDNSGGLEGHPAPEPHGEAWNQLKGIASQGWNH